jgi:hypothetical protein
MTQMDLATRYERGEHDAVWKVLRQRGSLGDQARAEAQAVAKLTMRRVRQNAEMLTSRLAARGWRAHSGSLLVAPTDADTDAILTIVETTGAPIPPSVHGFWTIVGGIDCVWDYRYDSDAPDLGVGVQMDEMDPLCVYSASETATDLEAWTEMRADFPPDHAASLYLAPDYLHKANISGGDPCGFDPLFRGADPIFTDEEHELPFIDYLRLAFRWGGFPRIERHRGRADVQAFVREMTAGMIPF